MFQSIILCMNYWVLELYPIIAFGDILIKYALCLTKKSNINWVGDVTECILKKFYTVPNRNDRSSRVMHPYRFRRISRDKFSLGANWDRSAVDKDSPVYGNMLISRVEVSTGVRITLFDFLGVENW